MLNKKRLMRIIRKPRNLIQRRKERKLLDNISGIVHIGANIGQERHIYAKSNLNVIWVEPIPEILEKLRENIQPYRRQTAYQALLTDVDNQSYEFNITNNNGVSSSIYQLKEHKEIWPEVFTERTITSTSTTMATFYREHQIDPAQYQGLVMDTQGSELLVLKGSKSLLKYFKFIKTEATDFESYEGCCQLHELDEFMMNNGFVQYSKVNFAIPAKNGGQYYNVIYVRPDWIV